MGEPERVTIDTREYVSMLRELTEQGHEVSMMIAGNSMSPFLVHERDGITFKKPNRELRRGDIVFYEQAGGRFICHRICKIRSDGYYMVGDAQFQIEGPIAREQIFGLITGVTRKGQRLSKGDFLWDFFEKVWIRIIPLRRPLIFLYVTARRFGRRFGRKTDRNADR